MKTYVIADIHGAHKALLQCLERSGFNKKVDTLIQLGDVADGWSEVYECVEELLSIPNLISIRGNHDQWFLTYINTGMNPGYTQGGRESIQSYQRACPIDESEPNYVIDYGHYIPDTHKSFFQNQINYYLDNENRLFVHAGFNRHFPITDNIHNSSQVLNWDRDLWMAAMSYKALYQKYKDEDSWVGKFKMIDKFKEVFIGHTATVNWKTDKPMLAANIWNLDTGAGFKGKLTIMDVDTKEYWQSDLVNELYPNEIGRT